MRRQLLPILALVLAFAATPALASPPVFEVAGVALAGTDPVAYFTEGRAVQGSPEITADYEGVTWHFASAENRDLFLASPEFYMPQYGGYCAFAAAKGAKATTDPQAWTILSDKLYLNYSMDIRRRWLTDPDGFIATADKLWPSLKGQ